MANNTALGTASSGGVNQTVDLNGKHSRSSANLDVAKISLTARVGPNDSPVIKRGTNGQSLAKTQSNALVPQAPMELYKKALPAKQIATKGAASVGIRSGTNSMTDGNAVVVNMSSNPQPTA